MAKKNTSPGTNTFRKNNIRIIGDNILFNNGIITAFYIIPLVNYSMATYSGREKSVDDLTKMITNLTTNNPTLTFTIDRIDKIIRAKDVKNNLINTINMYRPDYTMPPEFSNNIKDDLQSYCILGIDIQQASVLDVEDYTLTDTVKAIAKSAANAFAGLGNMNADPEHLLKIEETIYRTINYKCLRATKELVFYSFVSKVFPCYEISYDKLSYINENSFESIMGAITQTVSDNFGWFEMHNEGVDIFGLEPQTTYGCMLDIKAFPDTIDTANFIMNYPNCVTTVQCLKKSDAKLKIKRTRASDRYERDQAIKADAETEAVDATQTNIDIATLAIENLDAGKIVCQFNTSILVFATSREELKSNVMSIITDCKDRTFLASKSLTQALDFLDCYINKKPREYAHMAELSFPLSFQQNAGSTVGDTGQIWSPAIGVDL